MCKLVFIGAFDLNRKCAIPENKVGEGLAPPASNNKWQQKKLVVDKGLTLYLQ